VSGPFFNLYSHDFLRAAVRGASRFVWRTRCSTHNTRSNRSSRRSNSTPRSCYFPELGLSAYSCDDLFHQRALLDGVYAGLEAVLHASQHLRS